jgi:tRNA pseudouridine13 synthase
VILTLEYRYTDFLVNEILPSGEVLHLQNLKVPKSLQHRPAKDANPDVQAGEAAAPNVPAEQTAAEFKLSDDDRALLESLFGAESSSKIIDFHAKILASPNSPPKKFGQIEAGVVNDKDVRTKMHMTLRRVFSSLLESRTDNENKMLITAAFNRHKKSARGFRGETNGQPERSSWDARGGSFLHFTIYKENKDTMEIISFLARQMKMNAKSFKFAGTKDRRGVTVQRACVFKVVAERLVGVNKSLRNAVLGDYVYGKHSLELGDLEGNEFVITLRDCQFPEGTDVSSTSQAEEIVGKAMYNLRQRGYLNYYGMQRFGTFAKGTHEVGTKMIQGDFKGAVEAIMDFSPQSLAAAQNPESDVLIGSDDKARSEAIHIFQTTRNANNALDKLPRKFSAESCIIRALGRDGNDYLGALQAIPRNLRLMYVHAYQSLVWNFAASERWRLYGDKVVEGDLVISNQKKTAPEEQTVDADGEVIITPQVEDSSAAIDDAITRARPLSAEEAASGEYTVFDIVLTLPGYDVVYPENQVKEFYKNFMASEQGGGLDPFDMRRKWKDVSLHGGYRKLLNRPGATYSYEVKAYSQEDEQFTTTDLERLNAAKQNDNKPDNAEKAASDESKTSGDVDGDEKLATILKFQLGSGEYATMALRELMKSGGLKEYKAEFTGR